MSNTFNINLCVRIRNVLCIISFYKHIAKD